MRKIDKKLNMMKANLLVESNYLEYKGIVKESTNIEEIEGFGKRSAFNTAMDKYNKTPDWDVDTRSKYSSQIKTSMSHVNPEVSQNIKDFAKRFGLITTFKKRVGDVDNIPVFELYFNDGQGVSEYNYLFMYNITPMEYHYSPFTREPVNKPQGFDRAVLKLINYIQSKELNYHSNLKEESLSENDMDVDSFKNTLFNMEKPFLNDNDKLEKIISIYQSHIQQLNSILNTNIG